MSAILRTGRIWPVMLRVLVVKGQAQTDMHTRRMFADVGHCLLRDPKQHRLHVVMQLHRLAFDLHRERDPGLPAGFLAQVMQRGRQAQGVQHDRAQAMRHAPHIHQRILEPFQRAA